MIYGIKHSQKIRAQAKRTATCQRCNAPIFSVQANALCYWSHLQKVHCDPWLAEETVWSVGWKDRFPESTIDVVIHQGEESHMIDIQTNSEVCMKLADAALPPPTFKDIEEFFGDRMIWLIEGIPGTFHSKSWEQSKRPLFFDVGNGALLFYGSGEALERPGLEVPYERFLKKYL